MFSLCDLKEQTKSRKLRNLSKKSFILCQSCDHVAWIYMLDRHCYYCVALRDFKLLSRLDLSQQLTSVIFLLNLKQEKYWSITDSFNSCLLLSIHRPHHCYWWTHLAQADPFTFLIMMEVVTGGLLSGCWAGPGPVDAGNPQLTISSHWEGDASQLLWSRAEDEDGCCHQGRPPRRPTRASHSPAGGGGGGGEELAPRLRLRRRRGGRGGQDGQPGGILT